MNESTIDVGALLAKPAFFKDALDPLAQAKELYHRHGYATAFAFAKAYSVNPCFTSWLNRLGKPSAKRSRIVVSHANQLAFDFSE